jgi:D-tyrosyl-tRNA(Tyr) deacylase
MKTVIQRVKHASVTVDGTLRSAIKQGLLVLVGIEDADTQKDIEWLSKKIINLRIFDDEAGVMNLSLQDISGELLVVSQFTLQASVQKGNRPSYIKASRPEFAIPMYESFCKTLEGLTGRPVLTGKFGHNMEVELLNDGPVTIIIDTQNKK